MNRVVEGAHTNSALWAGGQPHDVKEVVVTRTVDAPTSAVDAVLSPASIVDMAGTYAVESVEETGDMVVVRAVADRLETVLEFTETAGPYVYQQRDGEGPFEAMYTSVSVTGDEPATVTARSCFTFGMPFPRLTDWFVARERRTELERLLRGVEAAVLQRTAGGEGSDDRPVA